MSDSTHLPVTVVIAARNEAENIVACIDSVRWAAEVIVAEHGSSDDTASLASDAGAIVHTECAETIGAQRNGAIARASHEWIFVVDADERATAEIPAAVALAIASASHEAYRVPRRNFFLGKEVTHGGWERDRPVRLFRQSYRYNDSKVHEHVVVHGEPGTLGAALTHSPYVSLDQYFDKFGRYSQWWAEQQYDRGRRTTAAAVVFKPLARFFSMYVIRLGFLDGTRGVILAALAAASVLAKYARLWGKQQERACAS